MKFTPTNLDVTSLTYIIDELDLPFDIEPNIRNF
jgi:hypothetical protein